MLIDLTVAHLCSLVKERETRKNGASDNSENNIDANSGEEDVEQQRAETEVAAAKAQKGRRLKLPEYILLLQFPRKSTKKYEY